MAAYEELIGLIERFNQLLFYAMANTAALLYFAMPPYTLVRYYVFNMGQNSYFLFHPSWFVFTINGNLSVNDDCRDRHKS